MIWLLWSLWLLTEAWLEFEEQLSVVLTGYPWTFSIVSSLLAPNRTAKKTSSKSYKYGTYKNAIYLLCAGA